MCGSQDNQVTRLPTQEERRECEIVYVDKAAGGYGENIASGGHGGKGNGGFMVKSLNVVADKDTNVVAEKTAGMYAEDKASTAARCSFFCVVDLDCYEDLAWIDQVALAIGRAVNECPWMELAFGLALCQGDKLTVFQYPAADDTIADAFVSVTTRCSVLNGEFRVQPSKMFDLEEMAFVTTNRTAFARALSSVRASSSVSTETTTPSSSCFFRSCFGVIDLLANTPAIAGAHVFGFTSAKTAAASPATDLHELDAVQSAIAQTTGEHGVGVDFYLNSPDLNLAPHFTIKKVCSFSGGCLEEFSSADIVENKLCVALSNRFAKQFVFRGLIRARCCQELIVGGGVPAALGISAFTPLSPLESVKSAFHSLISMFTNISIGSPSHDADEFEGIAATTPAATSFKRAFLGPGSPCSFEQDLWSVPSVSDPQEFALGFEIYFSFLEGLESMSYPRSAAIQIASSFVDMHGQHMIKVETKTAGSDRPIRARMELWHSMDAKIVMFVLTRLILNDADEAMASESMIDLKETVWDWCTKTATKSGYDAFQRKLGKYCFGLLMTPEVLGALMNKRTMAARVCNWDTLERYLQPLLVDLEHPTKRLSLKRSVLVSGGGASTFVMDSASDLIIIDQNGGADLEVVEKFLSINYSTHPAWNRVIRLKNVFVEDKIRSPGTPFQSTPRSHDVIGKDLLESLLLDDAQAPDFSEGYKSFCDILKQRMGEQGGSGDDDEELVER